MSQNSKPLKGKDLQHLIEDMTGVPRGTYDEDRPLKSPPDTPFTRLLKKGADFERKDGT